MQRLIRTLGLALALTGGTAWAAAPAVPADPRLDPVRPRLEQIIKRASDDGLPAELIVSKVREGLAKGVDPARIEQAASRLGESLATARGFLGPRRPGALPPELVRAVAEAHIAKIDLAAADPIVRTQKAPADVARAVEVLTDLSLRGYPTARAGAIVADVLAREPGAVGRVPGTLESLRKEESLSPSESADVLARGLRGGGMLEAAVKRAREDRPGRPGAAPGEGAGKGRQDSFVPPGQLKKQSESRGQQMRPDRGNSGMGTGMGKGQGQGQGKK